MTEPAAPAADDLRPRTVGEILDAAVALYRRRFGRLLLVATVLSIPTLAFAIAISAPQGESTRDYFGIVAEMFDHMSHRRVRTGADQMEFMDRMNRVSWRFQLYSILGGLLQAFARGVVGVAMACAAWEALHRRAIPGVGALVRRGLARAVPALGVHLLVFVVTALCSICIPVPIVAAALTAPACAVLAVETGPIERAVRDGLPRPIAFVLGPVVATFDAVARSCALGWHAGSVGRSTFLVTVCLLLLAFLDLFVASVLGVAFESFAVFWVVQHYVEVLLLPVVGLAFALWYADLRVRREALDLAPPAAAAAGLA